MGAGGIMKNKDGGFILAYSIPLGDSSNNKAKMGAAYFGITWCLQMGYTKVILEVDSQLLCK